MSHRKYTDVILRRIRNEISIEMVISDILQLPWKYSEGYFRFQCPKCLEERTAIKKQTNLARCFLCEENFNPIDIYIAVTDADFRETVEFLLPFLSGFQEVR